MVRFTLRTRVRVCFVPLRQHCAVFEIRRNAPQPVDEKQENEAKNYRMYATAIVVGNDCIKKTLHSRCYQAISV